MDTKRESTPARPTDEDDKWHAPEFCCIEPRCRVMFQGVLYSDDEALRAAMQRAAGPRSRTHREPPPQRTVKARRRT